MSHVVGLAPEPRVLGDAHKEATSRLERCMDLFENRVVFGDVFEDIKCAYHIKFRTRRNRASVHLQQKNIIKPLARNIEARCMKLAAHKLKVGERAPKRYEHRACAASHFKESFSRWKI